MWTSSPTTSRPPVARRFPQCLLAIVHPDDRAPLIAAWTAIDSSQARSVTCAARLECHQIYKASRVRFTRHLDGTRAGISVGIEDVELGAKIDPQMLNGPNGHLLADVTATPGMVHDSSYQELRRGAVTSYVRIPQGSEDKAVDILTNAGYIACREDGDPDCPFNQTDLYVERHYGMTNPDRAIQDRHRTGITELLGAADIGLDIRAVGVILGMPIPSRQLYQVLDTDGRTYGYTVRAVDEVDIHDSLTLVARTLNI